MVVVNQVVFSYKMLSYNEWRNAIADLKDALKDTIAPTQVRRLNDNEIELRGGKIGARFNRQTYDLSVYSTSVLTKGAFFTVTELSVIEDTIMDWSEKVERGEYCKS
ncbi:hypothetical protein 019DV002_55 [Bacillus phage 019DV002]|uniref:Uncharacterized protein n=1 Tax=Bacillus phage 019DV002 TaxID=2601653 RepID=A0A5J6T621_9CAUD|nr:hypothetical protein 019DV002_55 [Bacillus phage 019DV002]QFG05282.1 hypothetical protein 019DV004_55 [Bacillus phage 019DV004]